MRDKAYLKNLFSFSAKDLFTFVLHLFKMKFQSTIFQFSAAKQLGQFRADCKLCAE